MVSYRGLGPTLAQMLPAALECIKEPERGSNRIIEDDKALTERVEQVGQVALLLP